MIETFYILILLHQLSPLLPLLSRQASARGRLLHQGRAQESFSLAGWGQEAGWGLRLRTLFPPLVTVHGVKKVGFTAYHLGMLLLVCTSSLKVTQKIFDEHHWLQFFCNLNFPKNFTCPSGKSRTGFTSPIAKSSSPGLSDTTFFARCCYALFSSELRYSTT